MRVLFVASNPDGPEQLNLDREITELQRRFVGNSSEPIQFAFLRETTVEDLPSEMGRFKPDVLHISAHGQRDRLALADEDGNTIKLSADRLRDFLPPDHPPQLVYLNACNSSDIAQKLAKSSAVTMAIGSTAPITNRAARVAAIAFYERLLAGQTVGGAFEICGSMLSALSHGKADAKLFARPGSNPRATVLHPTPALIADFDELPPRKEGGLYAFRLGLMGCPASTTQVIFFTDDSSFILDEDDMEDSLSLVVRDTPVKGVLWAPYPSWTAYGDHRLAAVGLKAGGGSFVVEGTLCGAVERRYLSSATRRVPPAVDKAIAELRQNDGADLEPTTNGTKRKNGSK